MKAWISTDSRYYEDVKQSAVDFKLYQAGYDRNKALGEFAAVAKPKVMGYEVSHLTVGTFKDWSKAARKAGFKLKPAVGLVEELRIVKAPDELDKIKRAVKLTDEAFAHFCAVVKPGMTEKDGAWVIEKYMREHGADKTAFDLIVASGPNGALPHAHTSNRKIQAGEPIVIDIGCRIEHYHSDLTRTIILGKPDEQFNKVYKTVLKAQETAEKRIKAGHQRQTCRCPRAQCHRKSGLWSILWARAWTRRRFGSARRTARQQIEQGYLSCRHDADHRTGHLHSRLGGRPDRGFGRRQRHWRHSFESSKQGTGRPRLII